MAVTIAAVTPGSPAAKKRICPGDTLVSINGHPIGDVLDYRFYLQERKVRLVLEASGKERRVTLRKAEEDDIGLEFSSYLMDEQRTCRNRCVFCFIDQMPPGMRDSLYVKDDDSRMSFLFGNYITLTNLTEADVERIITMHISPVNVSVHTTDPELRCRMMNNRFAGDSLRFLHRLAQAGTQLNCQLVLCPGWNDGEALSRTLRDLRELWPAVRSVAAVPVGLTKYRQELTPLRLFTAAQAADVLDRMEAANRTLPEGHRLFYPSDEFFLLAGREIPKAEYFGEFSQLENGVGMTALLRQQFDQALEACTAVPGGHRQLLATGALAAPVIRELVDRAQEKYPTVCAEVAAIRNDFFGESITVAGLVTGGDMIAQLKGKTADRLVFPDCMLRYDGACFLDDVTPEQVEQALGIPVVSVPTDGEALLNALLY